MIFQVFSRYGDACGNEDRYHHCFVEALTQEAVEAIYPRGFFVGFRVSPITVEFLPKEVQFPGKEPGR